MKRYILLLLAPCMVYGQPNQTDLDNVIKILLPQANENGTGFFIGMDDKQAYVATALHVVKPEETGTSPEIILIASEKVPASTATLPLEVPGVLKFQDPKSDLAVISVDLEKLRLESSSGKPVRINPLSTGRDELGNCDLGQEARVIGYGGGSVSHADKVPVNIKAFHYYDNPRFFRTSGQDLEGGHSGAPVFGGSAESPELLGMVLQLNDLATSAKILKTRRLKDALTGIPVNLLKHGQCVGNWTPTMYVFLADMSTKPIFPNSVKDLQLLPDNSCKGMTQGTYCFSNEQIVFYGIGEYGVMLELPLPGGGLGPREEILGNEKPYAVEFTYNPLNPSQIMYMKLRERVYEIWYMLK